MKQSIIFILLLISIGCSMPRQAKKPGPYWPTPPDPPKIEFIRNIKELKDIGYKKSIFKKVFELVLGGSVSPKIIRPIGVFADSQNRLFVSDTDLQVVHIFDLEKKKYNQIFKTKTGRMSSPIGIAVDDKGQIFVTDSVIGKIFVYDSAFDFVREIENEDFIRISGITYNNLNGLLYVVDSGAHLIHVLDPSGEKIRTIGKRGTQKNAMNFPTHIFLGKKGNLYLSDSMNFRVIVMDMDGKFINQVGRLGSTIGTFSKPKGVAVDSSNNLYVVDGLYDVVQMFNNDGELLMSFGNSGSSDGEFWLPAGITIDDNDNIYIADTYNQRISVFRIMNGTESSSGF